MLRASKNGKTRRSESPRVVTAFCEVLSVNRQNEYFRAT